MSVVQKTGRILTGDVAGPSQILPHVNRWAWDCYVKGQSNNWVPSEIPMSKDVEQWRSKLLSDDERLLVRRCFGFFAGSESLVANNLLLAIFRHAGDPEVRQYLYRQCMEEALHNQTVVYVCESLGLDVSEVYEAYRTIPSIQAKDDFLMEITSDVGRPDFVLVSPETDPQEAVRTRQEVLRNIISYYVICEGMLFYSGFAMFLALGRQNKMPGLCEQIQYVIRDENVHVEFGTKLINTIVEQEPTVWTEEFRAETIRHVHRAVELEVAYAQDVLPRGILGLNAGQFLDYMRFIANVRLFNIGLPEPFQNPRNPFPWLAETIELRKQKNFFETRVTEYISGGHALLDDL